MNTRVGQASPRATPPIELYLDLEALDKQMREDMVISCNEMMYKNGTMISLFP